jgi:hypothetical protein
MLSGEAFFAKRASPDPSPKTPNWLPHKYNLTRSLDGTHMRLTTRVGAHGRALSHISQTDSLDRITLQGIAFKERFAKVRGAAFPQERAPRKYYLPTALLLDWISYSWPLPICDGLGAVGWGSHSRIHSRIHTHIRSSHILCRNILS